MRRISGFVKLCETFTDSAMKKYTSFFLFGFVNLNQTHFTQHKMSFEKRSVVNNFSDHNGRERNFLHASQTTGELHSESNGNDGKILVAFRFQNRTTILTRPRIFFSFNVYYFRGSCRSAVTEAFCSSTLEKQKYDFRKISLPVIM